MKAIWNQTFTPPTRDERGRYIQIDGINYVLGKYVGGNEFKAYAPNGAFCRLIYMTPELEKLRTTAPIPATARHPAEDHLEFRRANRRPRQPKAKAE